MPQARVSGITLEYDTFGNPADRPLLLVMGLGAQMIQWDEDFCKLLVDRGHYVIRYDNRDIGLSEKMSDFSIPDMLQLMADFMEGKQPEVPYTLDDMAQDGIALAESLGFSQVHICGASMGGMIVQAMAINHPDRIKSMTSIMSSTGNPDLPSSTEEARAALTKPAEDSETAAIQRAIEMNAVIGSPGFDFDVERATKRAVESFKRSFYPAGVARQMAAIAAHGDRRTKLNQLNLPVLVIHGTDDPLVPVEGGIDTRDNIPGSELLLIEGMGHDLPVGAWTRIADSIGDLTSNADARAA